MTMSYPIVWSTPTIEPPTPPSQWEGYTLEWIGWDGFRWDLNNWESGLVLDSRGVEGLHNPVVTKFSSQARGIPGRRSRGWRATAREVFWPIFMFSDSTAQWMALYRAFFATIHPDREGVWKVTTQGHTRQLRLTAKFDDSHAYDEDPLIEGWSQYGITLEADQPFWEGELIKAGPWRAPDSRPFFPEENGTDLFYISPSSAFGTVQIPNPGDVETWGTWIADGPLDNIEVGVGSAVQVVPFNVPAGMSLRIATDPRRPTALMGPIPEDGEPFEGADVRDQLGLQPNAAVPPGSSVPLHVQATGTGEIRFELLPLYFRAF